MAIQLTCDNCAEEISEQDAITVTVERLAHEKTVAHCDKECFDLAIKGDEEAVAALLLG